MTNTSDGHNNCLLLHISTCRHFFYDPEKYFEEVTFIFLFWLFIRALSALRFEVSLNAAAAVEACLRLDILSLTEKTRVNTVVVSCFYDLARLHPHLCLLSVKKNYTYERQRNKMMERLCDLFMHGE